MSRRITILLLLPVVVLGVAIWPDLTSEDGHMNKPRPKTWHDKNFGQWCRNFSTHAHNQCPEASLFHEYNCCGPDGADCCFAIQGWLLVVGGISSITTSMILIFYLLLKLEMICVESSYPPKTIFLN